jgi:hypothetical protein
MAATMLRAAKRANSLHVQLQRHGKHQIRLLKNKNRNQQERLLRDFTRAAVCKPNRAPMSTSRVAFGNVFARQQPSALQRKEGRI